MGIHGHTAQDPLRTSPQSSIGVRPGCCYSFFSIQICLKVFFYSGYLLGSHSFCDLLLPLAFISSSNTFFVCLPCSVPHLRDWTPMIVLTAETGESSDLVLTFSWVLSQDFSREFPLFWPKGSVVEIGETGERKMTPPVACCWMLQHFLGTYSGFATLLVSWIRQWQDKWGKGRPRSVTTTLLEGNASMV